MKNFDGIFDIHYICIVNISNQISKLWPKANKMAIYYKEELNSGWLWHANANRDISRLPLKPPKSFKSMNTIKTFCLFVFLWIWPKPVRGRQREENVQKTSWKPSQNKFLRDAAAILPIFKLVSSSLRPFCCFHLIYASFRSVTAKNGKTLTPTRTGIFLLTSKDWVFYAMSKSLLWYQCPLPIGCFASARTSN